MFQGSDTKTEYTNFLEPAFFSNAPVYYLQPQCSSDSKFSVSFPLASGSVQQGCEFLLIINLRFFFPSVIWHKISPAEVLDGLKYNPFPNNQMGSIHLHCL